MNFKTLLKIDGKSYIFSSFHFKRLCKENNKSVKETLIEIAKECYVSYETVRKWYRGKNGPNDYKHVERLAAYFEVKEDLLLEEKMTHDDITQTVYPEEAEMSNINFNTIRIIGILNELAKQSKNGFVPFSDVISNDEKRIIYDDRKMYAEAHHIVLDYLIDECHHDIISTYESYIKEFASGIQARVIIDEDYVPYAEISTKEGDFVIEDGEWYFVPN